MFGVLGPVDVGQTYRSFDHLFNDLKTRMAHDGYKVVKSRTHRYKTGGQYAKDGEIVRCDLVCDRGGQPYKCQATRLKTSTKKTDCPWKAKAVNRKTIGAWVLTVLCNEHNHEPRTPEPPSDGEQDADAEGDVENDVSALPMPTQDLTPQATSDNTASQNSVVPVGVGAVPFAWGELTVSFASILTPWQRKWFRPLMRRPPEPWLLPASRGACSA